MRLNVPGAREHDQVHRTDGRRRSRRVLGALCPNGHVRYAVAIEVPETAHSTAEAVPRGHGPRRNAGSAAAELGVPEGCAARAEEYHKGRACAQAARLIRRRAHGEVPDSVAVHVAHTRDGRPKGVQGGDRVVGPHAVVNNLVEVLHGVVRAHKADVHRSSAAAAFVVPVGSDCNVRVAVAVEIAEAGYATAEPIVCTHRKGELGIAELLNGLDHPKAVTASNKDAQEAHERPQCARGPHGLDQPVKETNQHKNEHNF